MIKDYHTFGSIMPGRSFSANTYNYGYQGSLKDDEIKGSGNSYSTFYRELDTRGGRWWSIDPKTKAWESPYVSMGNNPIWFNDPLGDDIKTNKEGAKIIDEGLTATLGKDNGLSGKNSPIGFDEINGQLTFNVEYDKTKFNDKQNDLINRYSTLIKSQKDIVNVKVVDFYEKGDDIPGKSLKDFNGGSNGVTVGYTTTDKDGNKGTIQDVFLARNPQRKDGKDPFGVQKFRSGREYDRGLASIHEIGGHSFYNVTSPLLSIGDRNSLTQSFENSVRKFYMHNGAPIKGFAEPHK